MEEKNLENQSNPLSDPNPVHSEPANPVSPAPGNPNFNPNQLHSTLGITALVLGILGLVISLIPCLGAFSGLIDILGIITGGVAAYLGKKQNAPINMAIVGIVLSVLGLIMASRQLYSLTPYMGH